MSAQMYQQLLLFWISLSCIFRNIQFNHAPRTLIRLRKILTHLYTLSFILIQLLNRLSQPFHLRCSVQYFLLITFAGLLKLFFIECVKFCGSRAIMGLVGLVSMCHCVINKFFLQGIQWIQNFFLSISRESKIFPVVIS